MHTKIAVHTRSPKLNKKFISASRKISECDERLDETLKSSETITVFDGKSN